MIKEPIQNKTFSRKGFTIIELVTVVGILGILSGTVVFVVNPVELFKEARDSQRVTDINVLNSVLRIVQLAKTGPGLTSSNLVRISIPRSGLTCPAGLPALTPGWSYECAAEASYTAVNGTGWLPIDFTAQISGLTPPKSDFLPIAHAANSPLSVLPIDPLNDPTTGFFYMYMAQNRQFEIIVNFESIKYKERSLEDGGVDVNEYESGSTINLWSLARGIIPPGGGGPIDPNLVGHWAFSEGAGSSVADSSGHSNTGAILGGPSWAIGKFGHALSFTGNPGEYVTVAAPGGSNLRVSPDLTLTAWVNTLACSDYQYIVERGHDDDDNYSFLLDGTCALSFEYKDQSSGYHTATADNFTQLLPNHWEYVSVVKDATGVTFYRNGAAVGFASSPEPLDNAVADNVFIGQQNYSGHNYNFDGRIDEVKVYNRALAGLEIEALYLADVFQSTPTPSPPTITVPSGLVHYYAFDGNANDSVGTVHGNEVGGPSYTNGKVGQALVLDGVNDYINLESPTELDNLSDGPVTYTAWVYFDALVGSKAIISPSDVNGDHVNGIGFGTPGNPNRWVFRRKFGEQDLTAETAVGTTVAGAWQHVAATWDATPQANNLHIYLNGVEMPHTASNLNGSGGWVEDHSASWSVGRNNYGGAYLKGKLDDVRIYNRVLSNYEVYQVYQAGTFGLSLDEPKNADPKSGKAESANPLEQFLSATSSLVKPLLQ